MGICVLVKKKKQTKISNLYVKKCFENKHINLLLIGEGEGKKHYFVIKVFNTFMYYHTLNRGRKYSCCYCLQVFSTEKY